PSILKYVMIAVILTAGTTYLMWLGEQITEKGIGNGISVLIFAGIAARIPTMVNQVYAQRFEGGTDQLFVDIVVLLLLALVIVAITVGIIFIQQGIRKIPIQYAKRVVGRKTYGGETTY